MKDNSTNATLRVVHGHAFVIVPQDSIRLGQPSAYGKPDHESRYAHLPAGRGE